MQRFARVETEGATRVDPESMALLLRDARCLAKHPHANIAPVLHVELSRGPRSELTLGTELIDGSTLADLAAAGPLPMPVLLRILVDVLGGLSALYALPDGLGVPLRIIHGEVCPANVVIGKDGTTRIVNALRRRPVRMQNGSEGFAYAAPETFTDAGTEDPRADVYAVGVMLAQGIAARDGASARLANAAARATAVDPEQRFSSAAEMCSELMAIAGAALATDERMAATVMAFTGDRIRTRRAALDPAASGTRLKTRIESNEPAVDASSGVVRVAARAGGSPPSSPLSETRTPGDFVVPLDVTDTVNRAARAPARRRLLRAGAVVAVALLAAGTLVGVRAMRDHARPAPEGRVAATTRDAPSLPAPPAAVTSLPSAPSVAAPVPPVRASASTGSGQKARAPGGAPQSKPKKSVYEPDGL